MSYDFKTGIIETVWTAELNKEIHHLQISPDGKALAFHLFFPANVKGGFDGYLATLNIETKELKNLYPLASPVGWYRDGKNILIDTNKNKNGEWLNTPIGILAKINIETGQVQKLHQKEADYQGARLSKDGRFIVYSRAVRPGGKAIFIRSMETFKETQVTKPIQISARIFSRDTNPDWYQGE
jgi:Tol biopolymer transport system component